MGVTTSREEGRIVDNKKMNHTIIHVNEDKQAQVECVQSSATKGSGAAVASEEPNVQRTPEMEKALRELTSRTKNYHVIDDSQPMKHSYNAWNDANSSGALEKRRGSYLDRNKRRKMPVHVRLQRLVEEETIPVGESRIVQGVARKASTERGIEPRPSIGGRRMSYLDRNKRRKLPTGVRLQSTSE